MQAYAMNGVAGVSLIYQDTVIEWVIVTVYKIMPSMLHTIRPAEVQTSVMW
jgi:hypothetical protein